MNESIIIVVSRFWERVDKTAGPDACWKWNGSVTAKWGYGNFRLNNQTLGAHRVAWILTNGDPGELCVLHRCDNRVCVNPAHLFLGTKKDNHEDMRAKGRFDCITRHKLTPAQVREIRRDYQPRKNAKELAAKYGVNNNTITQVANGSTWRNIR